MGVGREEPHGNGRRGGRALLTLPGRNDRRGGRSPPWRRALLALRAEAQAAWTAEAAEARAAQMVEMAQVRVARSGVERERIKE